jgi:hypothetical protein
VHGGHTLVVPAFPPESLAQIVDQGEEALAIRFDPGQGRLPDRAARDVPRPEGLDRLAYRSRVRVADGAVLGIEVVVPTTDARGADHRQSGQRVLHRCVVRPFDTGQAETDRSAVEGGVHLPGREAYR